MARHEGAPRPKKIEDIGVPSGDEFHRLYHKLADGIRALGVDPEHLPPKVWAETNEILGKAKELHARYEKAVSNSAEKKKVAASLQRLAISIDGGRVAKEVLRYARERKDELSKPFDPHSVQSASSIGEQKRAKEARGHLAAIGELSPAFITEAGVDIDGAINPFTLGGEPAPVEEPTVEDDSDSEEPPTFADHLINHSPERQGAWENALQKLAEREASRTKAEPAVEVGKSDFDALSEAAGMPPTPDVLRAYGTIQDKEEREILLGKIRAAAEKKKQIEERMTAARQGAHATAPVTRGEIGQTAEMDDIVRPIPEEDVEPYPESDLSGPEGKSPNEREKSYVDFVPRKREESKKKEKKQESGSYRVGTELRDDNLRYVSIIPNAFEATPREWREKLKALINKLTK